MKQLFQSSAALFGFSSILLGALVAHAPQFANANEKIINTAVNYQMWHALLLLWISQKAKLRWPEIASGFLCIVGISLFSGSFYLRELAGFVWVSKLAPFGGVSLMLSWILIMCGFMRRTR